MFIDKDADMDDNFVHKIENNPMLNIKTLI